MKYGKDNFVVVGWQDFAFFLLYFSSFLHGLVLRQRGNF
jgi:hypothetical protein